MHTRTIAHTFVAAEALEGAGVHLHRGFGYAELPLFDPFLLFDDFSSPYSADYSRGFPLHPHRGMETVTYVRKGDVTHRDSLGNAGTIHAGDVQWMTAGSGIVHEEMPHGSEGLAGFQLWVNLPREHKMMPPRYQEIRAVDIPTVTKPGLSIRVIAGAYDGTSGPVTDIKANPTYLDVTLESGASFEFPVETTDTCFMYIYEGSVLSHGKEYGSGTIILFARDGNSMNVSGGASGAGFLSITGTPLNEPIAWYGPIVMNTDEEIRTAQRDLRNGSFTL
jgi:quercetin 2,3-dioxygenase